MSNFAERVNSLAANEFGEDGLSQRHGAHGEKVDDGELWRVLREPCGSVRNNLIILPLFRPPPKDDGLLIAMQAPWCLCAFVRECCGGVLRAARVAYGASGLDIIIAEYALLHRDAGWLLRLVSRKSWQRKSTGHSETRNSSRKRRCT